MMGNVSLFPAMTPLSRLRFLQEKFVLAKQVCRHGALLPYPRSSKAEVLMETKGNGTRENLTDIEFLAWLSATDGGERLEYHRGYLAFDADTCVSELPKERCKRLQALRSALMQAAEGELVHLVQERLGLDCFAYHVIARPRSDRSIPVAQLQPLSDAA